MLLTHSLDNLDGDFRGEQQRPTNESIDRLESPKGSNQSTLISIVFFFIKRVSNAISNNIKPAPAFLILCGSYLLPTLSYLPLHFPFFNHLQQLPPPIIILSSLLLLSLFLDHVSWSLQQFVEVLPSCWCQPNSINCQCGHLNNVTNHNGTKARHWHVGGQHRVEPKNDFDQLTINLTLQLGKVDLYST